VIISEWRLWQSLNIITRPRNDSVKFCRTHPGQRADMLNLNPQKQELTIQTTWFVCLLYFIHISPINSWQFRFFLIGVCVKVGSHCGQGSILWRNWGKEKQETRVNFVHCFRDPWNRQYFRRALLQPSSQAVFGFRAAAELLLYSLIIFSGSHYRSGANSVVNSLGYNVGPLGISPLQLRLRTDIDFTQIIANRLK
jgi:hypothetical protein